MAVVIRFTPNKSDLVWAGFIGVRLRTAIFISFIGFFVILPLLFAVFLVVNDDSSHFYDILGLVLIPVVVVPLFLFLPVFVYRNSPGLKGEHTYVFTDDEIHLSGPGFDTRVQWSLVTQYVHMAGFFMLVSNQLPIVSIPTRSMSQSSVEEFEILLTRKTGIASTKNRAL